MIIQRYDLFPTILVEYKQVGVLDEVTDYCNKIDLDNLTTKRPVEQYLSNVFKDNNLLNLKKKSKNVQLII